MTATLASPRVQAGPADADELAAVEPGLRVRAAGLHQQMADERERCRDHTRATGEDAPEMRHWRWSS